MNRVCLVFFAAAVLSLVSGCAATAPGYDRARGSASIQDEPQPIEVLALADRMGNMPAGRSTGARTPVGEGVVRVTGTYVNALGEDCRRVLITLEEGLEKHAAVCRDVSGSWRFVRPLR